MNWTDDAVATLRRMAGEGATFTEVARALGDGWTRHMVAGKARRLGISFPVTAAKLSHPEAVRAAWAAATPEVRAARLAAGVHKATAAARDARRERQAVAS